MKNKKKPSFNEFLRYAKDIINSDKFKKLKKYRHHANHTIYRHSISVAYIAYKMSINKKNIDLNLLIRAALLHDYYLYDWHDLNHKRPHGLTHPKTAANNALRDFNITKLEYKAIKTHMFPLTLFAIPTSRIAWIISIADKRSALFEYKMDKKLKNEFNYKKKAKLE
jgi:uncharacterized protein